MIVCIARCGQVFEYPDGAVPDDVLDRFRADQRRTYDAKQEPVDPSANWPFAALSKEPILVDLPVK